MVSLSTIAVLVVTAAASPVDDLVTTHTTCEGEACAVMYHDDICQSFKFPVFFGDELTTACGKDKVRVEAGPGYKLTKLSATSDTAKFSVYHPAEGFCFDLDWTVKDGKIFKEKRTITECSKEIIKSSKIANYGGMQGYAGCDCKCALARVGFLQQFCDKPAGYWDVIDDWDDVINGKKPPGGGNPPYS